MATEFHTQFKPYQPKKGEAYMNPKQLEHFRKILTTLKEELSQDIDRTVQTMQDEATVFADPNDRASQESDMALELRNRDRERKLIKKIDEMLAKIDSGDYGYCEVCGVEIGVERLEARPTAELCIDCKTLDEIHATHKSVVPAKRYGTVEEFAAATVFLCSAQASYITAQNLTVDGGLVRAVM